MLLLPPVDKHPLKKLVKKLQVFSCALFSDAAPHSSRSARAPSATSLGLQPAPVMLGSDTFTDLRWRHQLNALIIVPLALDTLNVPEEFTTQDDLSHATKLHSSKCCTDYNSRLQ